MQRLQVSFGQGSRILKREQEPHHLYVNRTRVRESFISPRGLHESILTPDPPRLE